ncbi:MAG: phage terminase small subunit P27 family [Thermoleophilia bacterium]
MARAKPIEQHIAEGTYREDRHAIHKVMNVAPEADRDAMPATVAGHPWGPRAWAAFVAPLRDTGIVRETDTAALEMAVMALATWREAQEQVAREGLTTKGAASTVMHPALRVAQASESAFKGWAQRFGLTPSDRAALGMALMSNEAGPSEWDDLDDDEPATAGGRD